jgi:hypothetical protein
MTEHPPRPVALTVLPDNIPAELKALPIWSCWRYEWNGKKWTKVPYTPYTVKKAASTRPSSWRGWKETYACYQERSDFFDGVFICVSENDPYVGGDFDHTRDASRVPCTYAEYTPSDNGIRFIGRGTIPSACKKPEGELYAKARFLSITGHILPNAPRDIRPVQPALDKLYEELRGESAREAKPGTPGNGDRAANAAAISAEDWEAGRQLRRHGFNRLLARLRASAVSRKTRKDDTQLGYLLRENYADFAEKWPTAGLLREDGSLDSSQIRAVMASNIRSRGFTFPEFAALMGYFYGDECMRKWGTKERFREELATLWFRGRTPRADDAKPAPAEPTPRGRAGSHSALLDRAYGVLLAYKVGVSAIGTTQEIAEALGVDRRTMVKLLQELAETERITYRRYGSHGGVIIEFCDVIYSGDENSDVIYSENGSGGLQHQHAINDHSTEEEISAELFEEIGATDVIYSHEEDAQFSASEPSKHADGHAGDERGGNPSLYINTRSLEPVYIPGASITSRNSILNRVNLSDVVATAFDELPRTRLADAETGEQKAWPVTVARVVAAVEAAYPGRWKRDAIEYWTKRIRSKRKSETFRKLEKTPAKDLNAKIRQVSSRVASAERKAARADMPELAEWYGKLATQARNGLALLRWERDRRDEREDARLEREGYTLCEQAEMLELVEQARPRASPQPPRAVSTERAAEAAGLIERLKQARKGDE